MKLNPQAFEAALKSAYKRNPAKLFNVEARRVEGMLVKYNITFYTGTYEEAIAHPAGKPWIEELTKTVKATLYSYLKYQEENKHDSKN